MTNEEQAAADIIRRRIIQEVNDNPLERSDLEKEHGQVWDSEEVRTDFETIGFMAPFVVVIRRYDMAKGTLMFQHHPRYYWGFQEEDEG